MLPVKALYKHDFDTYIVYQHYLMFVIGLSYLLERLPYIHLPLFFQPLCFLGLAAMSLFSIMVRWRKEKVVDRVG
jgi:hypothetical protein